MNKILILSLFLLIILTGCSSSTNSNVETKKIEEDSILAPTYSAEADAAVEEIINKTEKKPSRELKGRLKNCICVKMWMPVCGQNKITYGNSCEAECAGVKKFTQGACQKTK